MICEVLETPVWILFRNLQLSAFLSFVVSNITFRHTLPVKQNSNKWAIEKRPQSTLLFCLCQELLLGDFFCLYHIKWQIAFAVLV